MAHFARDMLGFDVLFGLWGWKTGVKKRVFCHEFTFLTRFDTKTLHENDGFDF